MSGCWSRTPSEWLARAARELGCADPFEALGDDLAARLPSCFDDPELAANALVPGHAPLEVSFCELQPALLRFDFEPSPLAGGSGAGAARFAAFVGVAVGPNGVCELTHYRPAAHAAGSAAAARDALPG